MAERPKSSIRNGRAGMRHRVLTRVIKFLAGSFVRLIFRYKPERFSITRSPAVVLTNHNSDLDPAFIGLACRDHMYFVASSHIARWGFFGRVIRWVFDPIYRVKGTTEARAAMEILKTLRSGNNVCIFAEGNRSFNGETGMILPSTGKLVKRSGASLVTYRFEGGYLTAPRWGKKMRRGGMWGKLVREYSPEELAAMSDAEVGDAIARDLYVNAYEDQKFRARRYKGGALAEHIEIALYLCPCCGRYGSIQSEGDRFFCECGLAMRYAETGALLPDGERFAPYPSVLEWDRWQRSELARHLQNSAGNEELLFADGRQVLQEIGGAGEPAALTGTFSMFRDRFEFAVPGKKTQVFLFGTIDDVDTVGRQNLTFLQGSRQFELRSEFPRSPVKYREGYRLLTGKHKSD